MNQSPRRPRAIFFGTPEFAVPCLSALAEHCDVVRVITQPDRPAGRGMKLAPPPVKVLAAQLGLPVTQPLKVRTPEFAAELAALDADLGVVVAYGRILPTAVLGAPRLGCVNVHASLLPKYRGAAPIQWSIVRGETETGVCLMQMTEGLDEGPVLACAKLTIGPDETAGELALRLSSLGAELLRRELPRYLAGELSPVPQDHARATLAPILRKEDGELDFSEAAARVHDRVRGLSPWPGTYSWLDGARVKVLATARVAGADGATSQAAPGDVIGAGGAGGAGAHGLIVQCGSGRIAVTELQLEGKKRMSAAAYLAGRRLPAALRFAKPPS